MRNLQYCAFAHCRILYTEIQSFDGGWRRQLLTGLSVFCWSMSSVFVFDKHKNAKLTVHYRLRHNRHFGRANSDSHGPNSITGDLTGMPF